MRQGGWSWARTAWLVWGGLVLGFAAYGYLFPQAHTVYNIYTPAARGWWAGQDIYVRTIEYYRYSPLFAIALSPLALLPDCWGGALWKALNCLVYLAGVGAWGRRLVPARLSPNQLAGLFLLAIPLSLHSAYIGQANLLMLGGLLLGLAAAAEGRWNRAAAWLAAATLIKGYPLALALLLATLFPRRFAPRFAAALGAGLLLPFATQWPAVVAAEYASWFHHLSDSTAIMRERLRSLDHLCQVLGWPLSSRGYALLELAAGAAVLGLSWREVRRPAPPRELFSRIWLLFSAWVVLFGPATESCTYVVMAPSVAWAVVDASRRQAGRGAVLLLGASLLLMGPLVTDLFGSRVRNFANEHGSQPIGALLFLAFLLTRMGRRCAEPAAPGAPAAPVAVAA
jgi:hypothetical protein